MFGSPGEYKPLGNHLGKWDDNIKMDVKQYGRPKNWVNLFQDSEECLDFVKTVIKYHVPIMGEILG